MLSVGSCYYFWSAQSDHIKRLRVSISSNCFTILNAFLGAHVVPVRKLVDADQVISAKPSEATSTSLNVEQEENVVSGSRFVTEENINKSPKATYGKFKPDSEKPKIPRQIREIQENLTFEKIRRTGAKNTSRPTGDGTEEEPARDMSVEEMREFMEEQVLLTPKHKLLFK